MKKLFVLGLILALLLMSIPVLAEDGTATGNGDVSPTIDPIPDPTPPVPTEPAKIWTDKADYWILEFVTIYGTGFTPDATITVTLSTPTAMVREWTVVADSTGAFETQYTAGLGEPDYIVSATDGTITASTAFTDVNYGTTTTLSNIVGPLVAGDDYPFSGSVSSTEATIPAEQVVKLEIKAGSKCNGNSGGDSSVIVKTLAGGAFSGSFRIPTVGTYSIWARHPPDNPFGESSSDKNENEECYTVTVNAGPCTGKTAAEEFVCRVATTDCDVEEVCDGIHGSCPDDEFASASTPCDFGTSTGGACDGTDLCSGTAATCVDGFKPATEVCNPSAGQCDVAEFCTLGTGACPVDAFAPATTGCVGTSNGGLCDGTDLCLGTANTCVDGFKPATEICNPSAGQCDVAEYCTLGTGECPADAFALATVECTGVSNSGDCDGTDHCLGTANTCVDVYKSASTVCRESAGQCDVAEQCTGTSGACPGDSFAPKATACTGSSQGGLCDDNTLDHCSGTANTCVDVYKSSSTVCRESAGQCDVAEQCTGTSGACPGDSFAPEATACTGSSQGGLCDGADHCSGTANTCLDVYKSSSTVCRADAGQCDIEEKCTGTSGACPVEAFEPITTTCIGVLNGGACDGTDKCLGTANTCVDKFKGIETTCRPSIDADCDPAEVCSGTVSTCPTDIQQPNGWGCPTGDCVSGICQDIPEEPWWSDSSLCTLQNDQFNLIFTPDMQNWPASKLIASNPGQFYYNTLIDDSFNGDPLTITLPYPFITQGAVPAHVYTYVKSKSSNGGFCYVPGTEKANFKTVLTISQYPGGYGTKTTYVLNGVPTLQPGMTYYINVHLDYGLKGTSGYANDGNNNALKSGATTPTILIPNLKSYTISDSFWGSTITDGITNNNIFKKNPGFGAEVTHEGNPIKGAVVKVYAGTGTTGSLIGTMTTDEDGFAMLAYKYTGKVTSFTLKLQSPYSGETTVALKSNKFIMTEFTV
jgi:hypothetical protein